MLPPHTPGRETDPAVSVDSADQGDPRHLVLTLSCPDRPGIVHAVSGVLAETGGNITESRQFGQDAEPAAAGGTGDTGSATATGASTTTGASARFFMRVQVLTSAPREVLEAEFAQLAERFEMEWSLDEVGRRVRTVLMVSKEGHCLTDLLFRCRSQGLPVEPVAVVGNHRDLEPLATFYGVPFHHVHVTKETKAEAERRLTDLVAATGAELVVLARYMQILSDDLCGRLDDAGVAMINIHHSFLPSFKGARPYAQAHARGVKLIGATAHYVTADLDEGPIIEQDVERVAHDDAVDALVGIGQDVERRVLARAVRWHAEHRVLRAGRRTVVFR